MGINFLFKNKNLGKSHNFVNYQGRSWLPILSQINPDGWNEFFASHTFHDILMHYPMRVFRDRNFKLIWNIAHQLPYPFASDLLISATWQAQLDKGYDAPFDQKTVYEYINRPGFELYSIDKDPSESKTLPIILNIVRY